MAATDHADRLPANTLAGFIGEKMVNEYLATQSGSGGPPHLWMLPTSAEHPYDFEVLATFGAVDHVIDAPQPWPSD